jgi:uncharacterized protein (TIGR03066 family)
MNRPLTLVFCALLCLAGCSGGKNAKTIPGTWEVTKGEMPAGSTLEFAAGGKLRVTVKADGQSVTTEGTYSVEGNKLTTTGKGPDNKERKGADTIRRLTDTELVIEDLEGRTLELKKVR